MNDRIALFGGTFDPPHLSHALACCWGLLTGEVDRVFMIPASQHAFGKAPRATFAQRLEMCRLAVAPLGDRVVVSDIEGRRPGVSYMVDTIRSLRAEHPGSIMRLLVGSDIVADLPKWREGAEVLRLAPPLVIPRAMTEADPPGALPRISSSLLRERLAAHGDVTGLLAPAVAEYIRAMQLYQEPAGVTGGG